MILDHPAHPSGLLSWTGSSQRKWTKLRGPVSWDQANRITSFNVAGRAANYVYNGDGLRASKSVDGTLQSFTWDIAEGLPLIIQDAANNYVTGPGGLPLEQINGNTVIYYHRDQLGSTRALTDATGSTVRTTSFDAYGNLTASSGTAVNPFGFGGQYGDSETGLIYMRARYYDPATAQFLSRDSLAGLTREPYAYVADNPTNLVDPAGTSFNGGEFPPKPIDDPSKLNAHKGEPPQLDPQLTPRPEGDPGIQALIIFISVCIEKIKDWKKKRDKEKEGQTEEPSPEGAPTEGKPAEGAAGEAAPGDGTPSAGNGQGTSGEPPAEGEGGSKSEPFRPLPMPMPLPMPVPGGPGIWFPVA